MTESITTKSITNVATLKTDLLTALSPDQLQLCKRTKPCNLLRNALVPLQGIVSILCLHLRDDTDDDSQCDELRSLKRVHDRDELPGRSTWTRPAKSVRTSVALFFDTNHLYISVI